MSSLKRKNGRQWNQLRTLSVELGVLNRADGSVKYTQGDSSVLVAVYGPAEVKPKFERPDRATIDVVFKPRSGLPGNKEKEHEMVLLRTLEPIISSTLYPRTLITIVVQVLQDDGSLLSTALNACVLALMDAGISLKTVLVSVSCSLDKENKLLLDPCKSEEEMCPGSGHFVFDNNDNDGVISSRLTGSFTDDNYFLCLKSARLASQSIASFIRKSMEKKSTPIQDSKFIKPE